MVRVARQGAAISVEIWSVPAPGLAEILLHEPPGLSIGKVLLSGQRETLGVLAESILCQGAREITAYGGWRVFQAFMQTGSKKGDLPRPSKKVRARKAKRDS